MQGQYDDITSEESYGGEDILANWVYSARSTAPSYDNPWYRHVDYNGYNDCMHISGGSVLPNCVGYAWGRFGEILGSKPTLSRGDAGTWFGYTTDGYDRSTDLLEPRPGALMCFGKYGGAGHVCIVEEIERVDVYNDDGDVVDYYLLVTTSDSGYGSSSRWWTSVRDSRKNYLFSSAYYFQGFIYNPAVVASSRNTGRDQLTWEQELMNWEQNKQGSRSQSMSLGAGESYEWYDIPGYTGNSGSKVPGTTDNYPGDFSGLTGTAALLGYGQSRKDMFLRAAQMHVGQGNGWTCQVTGISSNQAWCAAYIVACAKQASSLLNIIIPDTYSCGNLGRIGRMREMGEWFRGPALGESIRPLVGDILLFRKQHYSIAVNEYYADHAGIVVSYIGNTVDVIEGDCDGVTRRNTYNISDGVISGLFRPQWRRVDISYEATPSYKKIQGLYTNSTSYKDAAVREVCYMNHGYQPSISLTNMKLSLLNYTGLLGDLYTVFGGVLTTSDSSNTSDQSTFMPTIASGGVLEGTLYTGSTATYGGVSVNIGESASICFNFLVSKGLNAAAACGLIANIDCESGFNTASVGDGGTSFGICQWHLSRAEGMKSTAGEDWSTDLSGQLDYLWIELTHGYYYSVLAPLLNVTNDLEGAAAAADIVTMNFEVTAERYSPAYFSDGKPNGGSSAYRQIVAQSYFMDVVTQDLRDMSAPTTEGIKVSINTEYKSTITKDGKVITKVTSKNKRREVITVS